MADRSDLGIIDLTKVAAPDIRVKLRRADDTDVTYRIPGNAPSGLMIELMVLLREIDGAENEDIETIADLRAQVQGKLDELFTLRNKDYIDGDVRLGDEELAALVAGLFSRYYNTEEPEEGGERPTEEPTEAEPEPTTPRSARRSRPSSAAARKARSRSSTSSPT
jgi:hypothetical protein